MLQKFYFLFCATLLTACHSFPEVNQEAPAVNELPPHTDFKIVLPEDHTTGYTWQLTQDYDKSVINQLNEVWHGNEKGIYFHLTSLAAGQTTLNFLCRMHRDTSDTKQFIIKITDK